MTRKKEKYNNTDKCASSNNLPYILIDDDNVISLFSYASLITKDKRKYLERKQFCYN